MKFNKHQLRRRHLNIQERFGFCKDISGKKVFRKGDWYLWQMLFLCSLSFGLHWLIRHSDRSLTLVMLWLVVSVFALGFLVKFLLSQIFPEVILDEKGVRLRMRKKILWEELSSFKIDNSFDLFSKMTFKNGKKLKYRLEFSDHSKLKKYCRSYFRKYRS